MIAATQQLAPTTAVPLAPVCQALALSRATVYRVRDAAEHPAAPQPRPIPDRALSPDERQHVLDVLHSEDYRDQTTTTGSYAPSAYGLSPPPSLRVLSTDTQTIGGNPLFL